MCTCSLNYLEGNRYTFGRLTIMECSNQGLTRGALPEHHHCNLDVSGDVAQKGRQLILDGIHKNSKKDTQSGIILLA